MRVALIGTGLIGGSIGLAVKASDPSSHVVAFDRDPGAAQRAVSRGAADEVASSAVAAVHDADVVFISIPVGSIATMASEVADQLKSGSVLTDVGSTKSRVVLEIEKRLPSDVSFVGGHPMSGSEDDGIEAARQDLFVDAWWILTPTERSDAGAYRMLHNLLTTIGARVMALEPKEHDELMAVVSHVPQLTATALMNVAAERGRDHAGLLALAAGGFRDVTRVAASNPEVWLDICDENADAIADALQLFAQRLLGLRDLINHQDRDSLRREFTQAREARRNLPGKALDGDIYDVRIPVPDRPGLLAEVTTAIGNLGINIEDLQITHQTEGGRGTLHLLVVGDVAAGVVVEAMQLRGLEAKASVR